MENKFNHDLPHVISSLNSLLQKASDENTQHLNYLENLREKADNANLNEAIGSGILGGLAGGCCWFFCRYNCANWFLYFQ